MFVQTPANCVFSMSGAAGHGQKAAGCHRECGELGHRRWQNESRGPSFADEAKEGRLVLQAEHFSGLACLLFGELHLKESNGMQRLGS